ncbi:MAG: hypothetical protein FWF98_05620 [Dehalococcoidia bacterium]|nr:hypothetical protein [Dehalococcoidia bacterium]
MARCLHFCRAGQRGRRKQADAALGTISEDAEVIAFSTQSLLGRYGMGDSTWGIVAQVGAKRKAAGGVVSRHATLDATPRGVRAARGGVSKAKTALFALRSSRRYRQVRRDIAVGYFGE